MPLHEIVQSAKAFADDLNTARSIIISITALLGAAKTAIEMFGKEKSLAF